MIAVVLPWMIVADGLLFDKFPVPDRGNNYRPNFCRGRSERFPVRYHEITYNGREGMVSAAIRQTFGYIAITT